MDLTDIKRKCNFEYSQKLKFISFQKNQIAMGIVIGNECENIFHAQGDNI